MYYVYKNYYSSSFHIGLGGFCSSCWNAIDRDKAVRYTTTQTAIKSDDALGYSIYN
jgi:hypothetical protein